MEGSATAHTSAPGLARTRLRPYVALKGSIARATIISFENSCAPNRNILTSDIRR